MRTRLVTKTLLAGSMVLVAIGFPARGEAGCRTPESACEYWPPLIPIVDGMDCRTATSSCEGYDCVMGAEGDAVFVSSSDDEEDLLLDDSDLYTTRWLVRHEGELQNISCEDTIEQPQQGSFLIMPDTKHCVVGRPVGDVYYLEFFASYPEIGCHGWAECRCVEEESEAPPQRPHGRGR